MPRRLAIARHAEGTDSLGWILMGFMLGVGATVAVLLHAEFGRRAASPAALASAPRSAPAVSPAELAAPAPILAPAILAPSNLAAVGRTTSRPKAATTDSGPEPNGGTARRTPPHAPNLPARRVAPADDPQMAEDAAAAGMTSRRQAADDIY